MPDLKKQFLNFVSLCNHAVRAEIFAVERQPVRLGLFPVVVREMGNLEVKLNVRSRKQT